VKLTCEENLAKYKKKGSCQKQGSRPRQGKKSKLSSKYQNTLVLAKLKEIILLLRNQVEMYLGPCVMSD
jgi:hypothetical protein